MDDATQDVTSATSDVWSHHVPDPEGTQGFNVRTTYPTNPNGVEVMLERWEAGTEEPPHYHPGDDMTIVVEGRMSTQFYRREGGSLVPDGDMFAAIKSGRFVRRCGYLSRAQAIPSTIKSVSACSAGYYCCNIWCCIISLILPVAPN